MNSFKPALHVIVFLSLASMLPAAMAQQAGQIDTFENGTTQGWREGGSPNGPTNQASGGPDGGNDRYLRNISAGGGGGGGKMVMFNTSQWSGNYNAAEILSIRMWVRNEGNNSMMIRIALGNQGGPNGTWWVSDGFPLPADNTWRETTFDLIANDMTRVQGSASLSAVLNGVAEMRIVSAVAADFRGDTIAATLGVDDIEAIGAEPEPEPLQFLDLVSLANVNGNNKTDIGVLRFNPGNGKNELVVVDGGNGNEITTQGFGRDLFLAASSVSDANGDQIPEYGVLFQGSLFARIENVVNDTLIGKPVFNDSYDPIAFISVDDAGGSAGPDVAMLGRHPGNGKVRVWVREAESGDLVKNMSFNTALVPFDAVAVKNVGGSSAMDVAVLGIKASGEIKATVKDARNGNLISQFNFNEAFTPLFFSAVHNNGGKLRYLAVLGRNANGKIRAQIKRASDGKLVATVKFSRFFIPRAFFSFADSNGNGSGEIGVVGINGKGEVRAEVKEIADGTEVAVFNFNKSFPALDAIAINGAAGTGRNEIAVLGQNASGDHRVLIKDLLTGNLVKSITLP